MSTQDRWWFRIGVLTDLVARSRTKLGRTALMKLAFLLQTVEGLPLGYNFRLYTYGPFDEDVLNDLGQAECMQAVVSTMIPFSGGEGYGYEFSPGPSCGQVRILLAEAIKPYEGKLDQMIERFGNRMPPTWSFSRRSSTRIEIARVARRLFLQTNSPARYRK